MIIYILKSSSILLLLILLYKLFLENEKSFTFNRFYLLISTAIAFIGPLISLEIATQLQIIELTESSPIYYLPTSQAHQEVPASRSLLTMEQLLLATYLVGLFIFSIKFILNLSKMIRKCQSSDYIIDGRYNVIAIEDDKVPHSFFHFLFLPMNANPEIVKHEKNHADAMHSIDVILAEFLLVIFWFNPLMYWHKKLLLLNHEFYADDYVNTSNKKRYKNLILHQISKNKVNLLASGFNFSFIKKRMIMLQKSKSSPLLWAKKVLAIPVLALLLFLSFNKVQAQNDKSSLTASKDKVSVEFDNRIYDDISFYVDDQKGTFSALEISKLIKSQWSPAFDKISFEVAGTKFEGRTMGYMEYTEAKSDLFQRKLSASSGLIIIKTKEDLKGQKYRGIALGEGKTTSVKYTGNQIPPPPPPPSAPPSAPKAPSHGNIPPPPPPAPAPPTAPQKFRSPPAPPTPPSASAIPAPPPPPAPPSTLAEYNAEVNAIESELNAHKEGVKKLSDAEVSKLSRQLRALKNYKKHIKE